MSIKQQAAAGVVAGAAKKNSISGCVGYIGCITDAFDEPAFAFFTLQLSKQTQKTFLQHSIEAIFV